VFGSSSVDTSCKLANVQRKLAVRDSEYIMLMPLSAAT